MGKFYNEIQPFHNQWMLKQKVFWVASAPLTGDAYVNVSPKGVEGSFHILSPNQVWYEDLTGSGVETIANIRENGRITIMFNAFEGPPRILRIFGAGRVYEFGTPEYQELLPPSERQPASRSIIMIDVLKVGVSCGWGVPLYTFKAGRTRHQKHSLSAERADIEAESGHDVGECPPRPPNGLKNYWKVKNAISLAGLPGVLSAFNSTQPFERRVIDFEKLDSLQRVQVQTRYQGILNDHVDRRVALGFALGLLVSVLYVRFISTVY